MLHVGSKKTYGRQNTEQSKHDDAKDRKRKCCRRLRLHIFQSTSTPFPSLWFVAVVAKKHYFYRWSQAAVAVVGVVLIVREN